MSEYTKIHHFVTKTKKIFWGGALPHPQSPPLMQRGHPLPHPTPIDAFGASIRPHKKNLTNPALCPQRQIPGYAYDVISTANRKPPTLHDVSFCRLINEIAEIPMWYGVIMSQEVTSSNLKVTVMTNLVPAWEMQLQPNSLLTLSVKTQHQLQNVPFYQISAYIYLCFYYSINITPPLITHTYPHTHIRFCCLTNPFSRIILGFATPGSKLWNIQQQTSNKWFIKRQSEWRESGGETVGTVTRERSVCWQRTPVYKNNTVVPVQHQKLLSNAM